MPTPGSPSFGNESRAAFSLRLSLVGRLRGWKQQPTDSTTPTELHHHGDGYFGCDPAYDSGERHSSLAHSETVFHCTGRDKVRITVHNPPYSFSNCGGNQ